MDRPLRLITANPVDQLARTLEALLVVASAPLSVDELADAAADDAERIELALGLLSERYREGRSGIVLEHVAGGYAFRAAREAAEACGRLFERPVERGLSQAALETLSIVAYLGPCSRPEIARIRGVAADSAVAGLLERGLITEAGRDDGVGGAVRYRTTPLFERVFGLESAAALPRLDDLGESAAEIREAAAPGLLVAQAIGRIGNWWNQELFGEPTDRAWGLEIDTARRPDEYIFNETFHPTFLYEALWNLGAAGAPAASSTAASSSGRRRSSRSTSSLYTGFRFYLETIRIDPSEELAGLRVNAWVSLILFIASTGVLPLLAVLPRPPGPADAAAARSASSRRRRWPSRAAASDPAASVSRAHGCARARAGPRRVRGPLRPAPDAAPEGGAGAGRRRHGRDRRRLRRAARASGRSSISRRAASSSS